MIRHVRFAALVLAACLVVSAALTPPMALAAGRAEIDARRRTASATDGAIEVRLSSQPLEGSRTPVAEVRVAGALVATLRVADAQMDDPLAAVRIVEIDAANDTPEVVLTAYTGGAHCCTGVVVADKAADGTWKSVTVGAFDGDGLDILQDPAGDGKLVFVATDDDFLYTFDCYACSYAPLKMLALEGGAVKTVTHEARFLPRHKAWLAQMRKSARADKATATPGFLVGELAMRSLVGNAGAWVDFEARAKKARIKPLDACPDLGFTCDAALMKPQPFIPVVRAFMETRGYAL